MKTRRHFRRLSLFALFVLMTLTSAGAQAGVDSRYLSLSAEWKTGDCANLAAAPGLVAVASSDRLELYGTADPARPVLLSRVELSGDVLDVVLYGDFAYLVVKQTGIAIVDVSNPLQPIWRETIATAEFFPVPQALKRFGDLLYLASREGTGCQIFQPQADGSLNLVGVLPGQNAVELDRAGSRLYFVNAEAGLTIWDLDAAGGPAAVGEFDHPGTWYFDGWDEWYEDVDLFVSVAVTGTLAYVADWGVGVRILDVTDPAAVTELAVVETSIFDLALQDDVLYVVTSTGLTVYDLTDPVAPAPTAILGDLDYGRKLYLDDGRLYMGRSSQGFTILDLGTPLAPVPLGGFITGGNIRDVAWLDDTAFVGVDMQHGLRVFRADDARPLALLPLVEARRVAVELPLAVVCQYHTGISVVGLADPQNPELLAEMTWAGYPEDVALVDGLAYVANGSDGLKIIDVSNPYAPQEVGTCPLAGSAISVTVAGSLAYVGDYSNAFRVVDVSDPAAPVQAAANGIYDSCRDLTVVGGRLYLATDYDGFEVWDLSATPDLVRLSRQPLSAAAYGVAADDGFAYVAENTAGLQVFPIQEGIIQPRCAWYTETAYPYSMALAVGVRNGLVLTAMSNSGLMVLRNEYLTAGVPGERTPASAAARVVAQPNPFNPATTIRCELPRAGRAHLAVYDLRGRRVRVLAEGEFPAGGLERQWDGRDGRGRPLPSGVYLIRLEGPGFSAGDKVVLTK